MPFSDENPFDGPIPDSLPLPRTPLTSVLAQVRFNDLFSISKPEFVADFQEAIRAQYPITTRHEDLTVIVRDENNVEKRMTPNWRFFDTKKEWRVSLSTNFVAIETRRYKSRADLSSRVEAIVGAMADTIKPNIVHRIGVRYVDRVLGPELERIGDVVRPEVLGVYNAGLAGKIGHAVSELSAQTKEGNLSASWGRIPARATHDENLMPPINESSWFLDIDVYHRFAEPVKFVPMGIRQHVYSLASRANAFFRWAVSDEFLRMYGGEV